MAQQTVLAIEGMSCQHCVRAVDEALRAVPGVTVDKVEIGSASLHVEDGVMEAARAAVVEAGFVPAGSDSAG